VNWRATLFKLHRDAGFLGLGLTLVYGVSGLATNHKHDWNYNLSTERVATAVGRPAELLAELPGERRAAIAASAGAITRDEEALLVQRIGKALGETRTPKNAFWRGPDRLSLFYETGERDTVDYAPSTGLAERKMMRPRAVLRSLNYLHLNEAGGVWTFVGDAFAVLLVFLGLSGALMAKGKYGLAGRGRVLVALGVLLPVVALAVFGRL